MIRFYLSKGLIVLKNIALIFFILQFSPELINELINFIFDMMDNTLTMINKYYPIMKDAIKSTLQIKV